MNRSAQMMIRQPERKEKHRRLSTAMIDSYPEVIA